MGHWSVETGYLKVEGDGGLLFHHTQKLGRLHAGVLEFRHLEIWTCLLFEAARDGGGHILVLFAATGRGVCSPADRPFR